MDTKVTRWSKVKSTVSNIDTLLKLWKWFKILFAIGVVSAAGVFQHNQNQSLKQSLSALEEKVTKPVKETVREVRRVVVKDDHGLIVKEQAKEIKALKERLKKLEDYH